MNSTKVITVPIKESRELDVSGIAMPMGCARSHPSPYNAGIKANAVIQRG